MRGIPVEVSQKSVSVYTDKEILVNLRALFVDSEGCRAVASSHCVEIHCRWSRVQLHGIGF